MKSETGNLASIPAEKYAIATWLRVLLVDACEPGTAIRGAEVGVKRGELASLLLRDERICLWLVDRWAPAPPDSEYRQIGDPAANASVVEHDDWHAEARERLAFAGGRAMLWHGESSQAADVLAGLIAHHDPLQPARLDFVYLDGDHSFSGRLEDLCNWYPLVRPGGVVAGGLLHSSFGGDCGRRALHEFLEKNQLAPALRMGPAQTWAFAKPSLNRRGAESAERKVIADS